MVFLNDAVSCNGTATHSKPPFSRQGGRRRAVAAQIRATRFHPSLYWATIIATTTLGTTLADFADRSLGLGYPGGVAMVSFLLAANLAIWYWQEGTVSGDWLAGTDRGGLGLRARRVPDSAAARQNLSGNVAVG